MKKKIISIITIMAIIVSMTMPAFAAGGDNVGEDIFDVNLYVLIESTGDYTIGEEFAFETTIYAGSLLGKTYSRSVTIEGPKAVSNFQYYDGSVWVDVDGYNVETTIGNDVNRQFKVIFNAVGTYEFNYKITNSTGDVVVAAPTKYVTITESGYSVSTTAPEQETTTIEESSSEETSTPEESSSEETSTPEESSSEETSTIEESSSEETSTPEESNSEEKSTAEESSTAEITTVEPSVSETTTVAPTEETTIDIATMKKPRKVTIKKINKKKLSAKKISLHIKKVAGATGYEVAVYSSKKKANKDEKALVAADKKSINIKVKSKKLANKKKLYVKVRAYVDVNGTKVCGKWSKVKKIKIKK